MLVSLLAHQPHRALDRRIKELRKALPNALVDEQRETDGQRYVAVGE